MQRDDSPNASEADGPGRETESTTGLGRLRARTAGRRDRSTTRPSTPPSPAIAKELVDGIDKNERMLGIAATLFAIFIAVIGFTYGRGSADKSVRDAADFFLISNLVFAAILALGVVLRRRALLGFGAVFFGLEQAFSYHDTVVGLPFIALGGWLIWRANQKQKSTRTAGTRPSAARSSQSAKPAGTPKASKRYTPPRRSSSTRNR